MKYENMTREELISKLIELSKTNATLESVNTELQSIKNRKKEELNKLCHLLDCLPIFAYLQAPDYTIRYANSYFIKLYGDPNGKRCYEAIWNREQPCETCPTFKVFETNRPERWESFHQEDGRTYEVFDFPFTDYDGSPLVLEFSLDITEHNMIESELKESRRKYETLLSNLPGMAYRCRHDKDWTLEYVSQGCENLTGYDPNDLVGNSTVSFANDVIHPDDLEAIGADIDSAINEKKPFTCVYRIITTDGKTKWVWEQGRGIFSPAGDLLALEGFITDISEQKKLEEDFRRTHKLESLGILAGGIAHDFNNLLTAILGNISLAKFSIDSHDNNYQRLTEAEKASIRAKDLTTQLLTFARGGAPILNTISFKETIMDTFNFALCGSMSSCRLEVPDDLYSIKADEGQISQVMHNLAINAIQAMPQGGIIEVEAENVTVNSKELPPLKDGKYVKLVVRDHGVGIPEEDIQKIFDPYFSTKAQGSGLGLSVVYSIVKNHNGFIDVVSKLGDGTTFYVYLPALDKTVDTKQGEGRQPITGKGVIIIMDDEAMVRDVAGEMLKSLGYDVEFAGDGVSLIEMYKRKMLLGEPVDAVIMDLTIAGGMGGKEAIKRLLTIDPDVKVIVSSGYSNDSIMSDFAEYGFKGVVAKPYRLRELGETVSRVIKGGSE